MSKKFKIGVPVWEVGQNTLGVTKPYIAFIKKFGRVIYLDPQHEVRKDLDMILLPGGADVDTRRYNQSPGIWTGKPDIYKEWFDFEYLQQYMDLGTAIFCTCRGMQSMWVHLGGELHQDLMLDCQIYDHPTNPSDDPHSFQHFASVETDSLVKINNMVNQFTVNSRHHQVVDDSIVPKDVTVISRAITANEEDNTVEAFIHDKLPIVAFQSHCEDHYTPFAEKLIRHILNTKQSVLKMKDY